MRCKGQFAPLPRHREISIHDHFDWFGGPAGSTGLVGTSRAGIMGWRSQKVQKANQCQPEVREDERFAAAPLASVSRVHGNSQGERSPVWRLRLETGKNQTDRERQTGSSSGGVPLWRCGGDHSRPLLWPGSRSRPSAWSRVCLREESRCRCSEKLCSSRCAVRAGSEVLGTIIQFHLTGLL